MGDSFLRIVSALFSSMPSDIVSSRTMHLCCSFLFSPARVEKDCLVFFLEFERDQQKQLTVLGDLLLELQLLLRNHQHALLYRALGDQLVDGNWFGLAHPMGSVLRLFVVVRVKVNVMDDNLRKI